MNPISVGRMGTLPLPQPEHVVTHIKIGRVDILLRGVSPANISDRVKGGREDEVLRSLADALDWRDAEEKRIEALVKTDLVALIGTTVPLIKHGQQHVGICPFDNSTHAALRVDVQKQHFYCSDCKREGNAIDWMMYRDRCSFNDAVSKLIGITAEGPRPHALIEHFARDFKDFTAYIVKIEGGKDGRTKVIFSVRGTTPPVHMILCPKLKVFVRDLQAFLETAELRNAFPSVHAKCLSLMDWKKDWVKVILTPKPDRTVAIDALVLISCTLPTPSTRTDAMVSVVLRGDE